ncbi:MAG: DMT family transporter [Pseudomonadota bacterium]
MNLEKADNVPLAVVVITLAVLALSLGDALIKFTSGEFVIWQVFVLRSLLALPVLFLILFLTSPEAFIVPPALFWTTVRSLMLVVMWIAYYLALPNLDFSIAAAAYYTLPIFIILFSAVFLGEKITHVGWGAVSLGFLGVVLILRPDASEFNLYALLPLFSAILYAMAMILTRTKCRDVNPIILSIALNVAFVVVGALTAIFISGLPQGSRDGYLLNYWTSMGRAEWLSMFLLALAILIGSLGAAYAYQKASPSVLGSVEFAYVGFAVIWGVAFFAEIPDAITLLGIGMIIAAGMISLRQ